MEPLDLITTFLRNHRDDYNYFIRTARETSAERLWQRALGKNSIANLLCHVAEMEQFWIDGGLGGQAFDRQREKEFERQNDLTNTELVDRLQARCQLTQALVAGTTPENLERRRFFHGDEMTGAGILLWHTRHLGLHRGQALMLTRHLDGNQKQAGL
jgi:uncharacterized damage-inducible protein DinB